MLSTYNVLKREGLRQYHHHIKVESISRKIHNSKCRLNVLNMNDLKNLLNQGKSGDSIGNNNNNNDSKKDNVKKDFKKFDSFSKNNEFSNGKSKYGNKNNYKNEGKGDTFKKEFKNLDKTKKSKDKKKGEFKNKKKYDKRDYISKQGREEERKEINKKFSFLETGNDRDKDAAKRIINESIKTNSKGLVQVIRDKGKIDIVNVIEAFDGIILKEKGIIIVGYKNIKEEDIKEMKMGVEPEIEGERNNNNNNKKYELEIGIKIPVLKIVDRKLAIKQYGDYLNEQVVEKLKSTNNNVLNKQLRNKKDDNNKNEIKIVQIGWNITLNDLTGQKRFEIENHIKKGNDVEIIFDDREYLDKENASHNKVNNTDSIDNIDNINDNNDNEGDENNNNNNNNGVNKRRRKELNEAEKAMRNKMITLIHENLLEIEGLPESNIIQKGLIESRVLIKVKGIVKNQKESKENKKERKQQEKAMKAEKMRLRRLEKERLAKENIKELVV